MILIILGILDLLAALTFIFLKYNLFVYLGWIFSAYLIVKGIIFFKNFFSLLDFFAGIFLIFATLGIFWSINWIFVLWLLQKSFFSFVNR